ncbi:hypothetical protein HMPREF3227_01352 [Corynebacterium sp. CMW7794]|nr:hypothetical protein HMPREF3227_01352 [Corynebacterium sp. CMW7794]
MNVSAGDPRDGLIPAHAGSTGSRPAGGLTCGAHPRSRGEHVWRRRRGRRGGAHPRSRGEHHAHNARVCPARGSSPLTRGALAIVTNPAQPIRLIPAHAGSTSL